MIQFAKEVMLSPVIEKMHLVSYLCCVIRPGKFHDVKFSFGLRNENMKKDVPLRTPF